jgi:hypothetical protein
MSVVTHGYPQRDIAGFPSMSKCGEVSMDAHDINHVHGGFAPMCMVPVHQVHGPHAMVHMHHVHGA